MPYWSAPPPRESSDGGSGSAFIPLEEEERARAGVLGMPGRCSHEKGTEEERSGEGRNRWNGDGEVGGKKENGEAGAKEGEWLLGLDDGKSRRRRRGVDTAEEGVAAGEEGRDGEAGIVGSSWCDGSVAGGGILHSSKRRWWAGFYGARARRGEGRIF